MSANIYTLKQEIIEVGKRMYDSGFVAANDGNISARLDEDRILITPTGVSKGFMKAEELCIVDLDGQVVSGTTRPSSEVFMHLEAYKTRDDVKSVCHAHPPYATAFAVAGVALDKCVLPEVVVTMGEIPLVEYGTPGTEEFYKPLAKYFPFHDALLLSNHGALTVGKNVIGSYYKMETLEHFAKIYSIALQIGKVNYLNKDQVSKLIDLREKFGVTTGASCKSCENIGGNNSDLSKADLIQEIVKEVTEKLKK